MADISQWRKTLLTLPDTSFFELVRNYLGEVQTPFNKQSLLDRLQAFLKRPTTQEAMIASIDEDDARFLSAVQFLDGPIREQLLSFLGTEYTRLEIQNRLLNLQDRLLVFPDAETDRLHINPVLEPVLSERIIGPSVLFPRTPVEREPEGEPWLTDTLLAAVFSLLMEQPLSFRADGRLKKRDANRLSDTAPLLLADDGRPLELVRHALSTLGLVEDDGTDMKLIVDPWRDFARLSTPGRLATTWAAAAGIGAEAGCVLQTTLASVATGYALRDSHLLQLMEVAAIECGTAGTGDSLQPDAARSGAAGGAGQRSGAAAESGPEDAAAAGILEALCELGVFFGSGDNRYAPRAAARSSLVSDGAKGGVGTAGGVGAGGGDGAEAAGSDASPAGVVTPSYQLTITPAAGLGQTLPAVAAAELLRYDRYCEYEIRRDAVVRAFRAGFRGTEITAALEELHHAPLPQNVAFSISTWGDEYERLELLDGVVLLVDESHAPMLEHSPHLAPFLRRRLGPGAFLLSRAEEREWRQALGDAGVGAVPEVKTVGAAETPQLRAHRFREPRRVAPPGTGADTGGGAGGAAGAGAGTREAHEEALLAAADGAALGDEQRREVRRRIERRLIVVPEQITRAVVPRDVPEARGLDYVGKVRLIEQALSRGTDYLEIVERGSGGGPQRLFLRPTRLDKRSTNLLLYGETVGEGREVSVRVDKIGLVRLVRGTLFVR
ncbi:MAG: hypothetical protein GVY14_04880 [Spirochaetes bacterium]|nr:hypothetical protein [Spirochaetota bacterium]